MRRKLADKSRQTAFERLSAGVSKVTDRFTRNSAQPSTLARTHEGEVRVQRLLTGSYGSVPAVL
jgi:hypothetical protein